MKTTTCPTTGRVTIEMYDHWRIYWYPGTRDYWLHMSPTRDDVLSREVLVELATAVAYLQLNNTDKE